MQVHLLVRAVLISVGAHAVVIAGLATAHVRERAPRDIEGLGAMVDVELPLEVPHDVELIPASLEVALVAPAAEPAPSVAPTTSTTPRLAIARHARTATGERPAVDDDRSKTRIDSAAGGGASLRMRGLRHDLQIPATTAILAARPVEPVATPPADDRLRPRGSRGHVVLDRVTRMRVAPDGTVAFQDKRDFTVRLPIPISLSRDDWEELHDKAKRHFQAWLADPYAAQRPVDYREVADACAAGACDPGGDNDEGGGLIGGKADLTAALHRKFIGDPFASRKRALLDSTREVRAEIGANHRTQQLDRSAELVSRNLEALWRATPDAGARRAALFAMWDECEEGEGPAGQAGQRARAMIVGFIRARLPAGSQAAFSDREIAALDASRTSRQRFVPY